MTAERIRDLAAARAWRAAHRGTVVFTNGVFDLLHRGHVEFLESARALGDALIVAVNSDASTARLGKGPGRPFVPEADRARLVAALACVDCVLVFDDDTPVRTIDALTPDVLVKDDDWTADGLPGAETVRARGGRVALLPRRPDRSTTLLVERIRAAG